MSEILTRLPTTSIDKIRLLKENDKDSYVLATESRGREYYNIRTWGAIPKVYSVKTTGAEKYEPNWWEYEDEEYVKATLLVEVDTPAEYNQWVKDHPEYFI